MKKITLTLLLAASSIPVALEFHNSNAQIEKLQKQIWKLEDTIERTAADSELEDYKISQLMADCIRTYTQERSYWSGPMSAVTISSMLDVVLKSARKETAYDTANREERIIRFAKNNPSLGSGMNLYLKNRLHAIGLLLRDERENLKARRPHMVKHHEKWIEAFKQEQKRITALRKPQHHYSRIKARRQIDRAKQLQELLNMK